MNWLKSAEIITVVTGGWLLLVLILQWLVVPAVVFSPDPSGTEPLLVASVRYGGVAAIAAILTGYVVARGRGCNAWGWNWERRRLGAGALVAVVLLVLFTVATRRSTVAHVLYNTAAAATVLAIGFG